MNVIELSAEDPAVRKQWNEFVSANFAPVGAFLQSWEWGDFKGKLHGTVTRFAIVDAEKWIACFQMETHSLPFGLTYGYAPRGPVLSKELWEHEPHVKAVFDAAAAYIQVKHPEFIFVRFEPAHRERYSFYTAQPFRQPNYYLQPRFNRFIRVASSALSSDELLKTMSNDIRHDIRAGERLGVTVEDKDALDDVETKAFEEMKSDTRARSGKAIFPSDRYFDTLLASFKCTEQSDHSEPCVRYFVAKKEGVPVAINLNVCFADTLTYLYGASYSGPKSKRAPAYLHWQTILYAGKQGFTYYDLGGVDDTSWKGLSYFKKQFGGETMEYVGTVTFSQRPFLYFVYRKMKRYARKLKELLERPQKRPPTPVAK